MINQGRSQKSPRLMATDSVEILRHHSMENKNLKVNENQKKSRVLFIKKPIFPSGRAQFFHQVVNAWSLMKLAVKISHR